MIRIGDESFNIENVYERNITIPDSFVTQSNKIGTGHGEAKLYIGDKTEVESFFDFSTSCTNVKAFMLKRDLLNYLNTVRAEYMKPSQNYASAKEMPYLWEVRQKKVEALPEEVLLFDISYQDQIAGPRGYINSRNKLYTLIRDLSLPMITFLSIMKLKDLSGSIIYYLRLFVDFEAMNQFKRLMNVYNYRKKVQKEKKPKKTDKPIVQAITREIRTGQADYRQQLLDECKLCPITMIVVPELLVASHIKPFCVCDKKEQYDPKNGFIFSPLYDKLFDKGFLTFTDEKRAVFSPWLREYDLRCFELKQNSLVQLLPLDEDRLKYLRYHREHVFRSVGSSD